MKQENKDILIDIKRMKIRMIKIRLGLGPAGCYGIYHQKVQVIKILKKDLKFNLSYI